MQELGGASAAVGKLVNVEGESFEVIGVMPRGFDYPQKTSSGWAALHYRGIP